MWNWGYIYKVAPVRLLTVTLLTCPPQLYPCKAGGFIPLCDLTEHLEVLGR
jgi:hypothetical protein